MKKLLYTVLALSAPLLAQAEDFNRYEKVDYIESHGGAYIDTGIHARNDTKIVADMQAKDPQSGLGFFGTVTQDGAMNCCVYVNGAGGISSCLGPASHGDADWTGTGVATGTERHTFVIDAENRIFLIDGNSVSCNTRSERAATESTYTILVGARKFNEKVNQCDCRIYGFKIYEGRELVCDCVPCVRKTDRKPGLFDVCRQTFYSNAGKGTFTAPWSERKLPEGYRMVDYLESDGKSGQYIDTEYGVKQNSVFEIDMNPLEPGKEEGVLFGAGTPYDTSASAVCLGYTSDKYVHTRFGFEYEQGKIYQSSHRFTAISQSRSLFVNGQMAKWNYYTPVFPQMPIYIFACDLNDKAVQQKAMRLYAFRIFEGSELKRDYVPCVKLDTVASGLYDVVKDKFYANAGGGTLTTAGSGTRYTEVPYVSLSEKAYFVSGVMAKYNTKIVADMQAMNPKKDTGYFGVVRTDGNMNCCVYVNSGVGISSCLGPAVKGQADWTASGMPTDKLRHTFVLDAAKEQFLIDGLLSLPCRTGYSHTAMESSTPILIGARDFNGSHQAMDCRIYGFKIYEGDTLVRDFMPCVQRSENENVSGLYDKVNGVFYSTANSSGKVSHEPVLTVESNGTGVQIPFRSNEKLPDLTPRQMMEICQTLEGASFAGITWEGIDIYDADGKALRTGEDKYDGTTAKVKTDGRHLLVNGKDVRVGWGGDWYYDFSTRRLTLGKGNYVLTTSEATNVCSVVCYEGADVTLSNCTLKAETGSALTVLGKDVTLRLTGRNMLMAGKSGVTGVTKDTDLSDVISVAKDADLTVEGAPLSGGLAMLTITEGKAAIAGEGHFSLAGGTVNAVCENSKCFAVNSSSVTGGSLRVACAHNNCFTTPPQLDGEPLGRVVVPLDLDVDTPVTVEIIDLQGQVTYGDEGLSSLSDYIDAEAKSALYLYLPAGIYQIAVAADGETVTYRADLTTADGMKNGGTVADVLNVGLNVNGDPLASGCDSYTWDAASRLLVLKGGEEPYVISGADSVETNSRTVSCLAVPNGATASVTFDGIVKFCEADVNADVANPGTLVIKGGTAWGLGQGTNVVVESGSIALSKDSSVTDADGNPLSRVTVTLARATTNVVSLTGDDLPDGYKGASGLYADGSNRLYLWLPNGTNYAFEIDGFPYETPVISNSTEIACRGIGLTVNNEDVSLLKRDGWTWDNDSQQLTLSVREDGYTSFELAGRSEKGANLAFSNDTKLVFADVTRLTSVTAPTDRKLTIQSGTLTVDGPLALKNGLVINGGSLNLISEIMPVNDRDEFLYLAKVDLVGPAADATAPVSVAGLGEYKKENIVPQDGCLYLWLPAGYYEFAVEGVPYVAQVENYRTTVRPAAGVRLGGIDVALKDGDYDASTGRLTIRSGSDVVLDGTGFGEFSVVQQAGSTVTLSNVAIVSSAPYAVEGSGEAKVLLFGSNALVSVEPGNPAVAVGEAVTLTVSDIPQPDAVATLMATGADYAAGIGVVGDGGRIVLAGGIVEAVGGLGGAGIGTGFEELYVPEVEITAGTVRAVGGAGAAGIGGGFNALGAWVSICGGDVTVCGGTISDGASAAGIGWGVAGSESEVFVSISGGTVSFEGEGHVAAGSVEEDQPSQILVSGGSVNCGARVFLPQSVVDGLPQPVVDGRGHDVHLVRLVVNAREIRLNNPIVCSGLPEGYGTADLAPKPDAAGRYVLGFFLPRGRYDIVVYGRHYPLEMGDKDVPEPVRALLGVTVNGVDASVGREGEWSYDGDSSTLSIFGSGTYVLSGDNSYGEVRVEQVFPAQIVMSNLALTVWETNGLDFCASPYRVRENEAVKLWLEGTNTIESYVDAAGLLVPAGASLTINAASGAGAGATLNVAVGVGGAAAIGGDRANPFGTVKIAGGSVNVDVQGDGAGIGGGCYDDAEPYGPGLVAITGGRVSVIRRSGAGAGIGTAADATVGCGVDISGGNVSVQFADMICGAAIGGGVNSVMTYEAPIHISGGTVVAMARPWPDLTMRGADIGDGLCDDGAVGEANSIIISGGSLFLRYGDLRCDGGARDADGNALSLVTVPACEALAEEGAVKLEDMRGYGTNDMSFVDLDPDSGSAGSFCLGLWLPAGDGPYEFRVNGFRYQATVAETNLGNYAAFENEAILHQSGVRVTIRRNQQVSTPRDCANGVGDNGLWHWYPDRPCLYLESEDCIYALSGSNTLGEVLLAATDGIAPRVAFPGGVTLLSGDGPGFSPIVADGLVIQGGSAVLRGGISCDCIVRGGSLLADLEGHAYADVARKVPLYPVRIDVPHLREGDCQGVRAVTVTGLDPDFYNLDEIYASDGKICLWLPKADAYELVVDSVHYRVTNVAPAGAAPSFASGQDPAYNNSGVRVNGVDIANGRGPGWAWTAPVLELHGAGPFVLSGGNALGDVSVVQTADADVTLDGLRLSLGEGAANAPYTVAAGVGSRLFLKGTNMLSAAETSQAGLQVETNASVRIDADAADPSGRLEVFGGANSAGIGGTGGKTIGRPFGLVEIVGGDVCARGGANGAGIGGGSDNRMRAMPVGAVRIAGGRIECFGGANAAGVGSGRSGGFVAIEIAGGRLTATGGANAAGIGGGLDVDVSGEASLVISGGTVVARRGKGGVNDIGGSGSSLGPGALTYAGSLLLTGGSVFAETLSPAPSNGTERVWCVSVEVEKSKVEKLKFEGLGDYGTNDIYAVDGEVRLWLPDGACRFIAWNAETSRMEDRVCSGYSVVTDETATFEDGKWYVVTGTVSCGMITVNGSAHLILCDGAKLTVTGGTSEPGISVVAGNSLFIYGQALGTGELVATGGEEGAGIGGGAGDAGGTVTINGGTVTARGGEQGAGIGRGMLGDDDGTVVLGGNVRVVFGGMGVDYQMVKVTDKELRKVSFPVVNGLSVRATVGDVEYPVAQTADGPNVVAVEKGEKLTLTYSPAAKSVTMTGKPVIMTEPVQSDLALTADELPKAAGLRRVSYQDWTGSGFVTAECDAAVLSAEDDKLLDGCWYAVTGSVRRTSSITVTGTARLILSDGAELAVQGKDGKAGLAVGAWKTLTIYGQEDGTGLLSAIGGRDAAGIGGGGSAAGGTVTIDGGTVTAQGGENGAGIGGSSVTINGGVVRSGGDSAFGATVALGNHVTAYDITGGEPGTPIQSADELTKVTRICAVQDTMFVTVTVGELSHMTAAWTSGDGGSMKAVENGSFVVAKGATGVRVVFTPEEGYALIGSSVVGLGTVCDDMAFGPESGYLLPGVIAPVPYLDWDAENRRMEERVRSDYSVVTDDTATFEDGKWYVVTGTVVRGTITVNGSAHLILCDGAKLTVTGGTSEPGISVVVSNAFSIYGQTLGTGELVATGGEGGAGIGGGRGSGGDASGRPNGSGETAGEVTICGGVVTATGVDGGAGIGGGAGGNGGDARYVQGDLASILGGRGGDGGAGGTVVVLGGSVIARSDRGADIGGGAGGHGGKGYNNVTSNDGKDGANGADGAVSLAGGIFGMEIGDSWIAEDHVKVENPDAATCGDYPWAVIPDEVRCSGGDIVEVEDGVWVVTPFEDVTEMRVWNLPEDATVVVPPTVMKVNGVEDGQIMIWNGANDITEKFVIENGTIRIKVTVGSPEHMTAVWTSGDGGETYAVKNGSFTVPYGTDNVEVIFTAKNCYELDKTEYAFSDPITENNCEIPSKDLPTAVFVPLDVVYLDWDETGKKMTNATLTVNENMLISSDTRTLEKGRWYVVMDDVVIDNKDHLTVNGEANLILADGASLTVTNVYSSAAILVTKGNSLVIYGQAEGTGRLTVNGGGSSAGIGGGNNRDGGTVTINGGIVKAKGGTYSAGIGGGWDGNGGTVTINGGTVTATGGTYGAGIGGGLYGDGGSVTITGGRIDAAGDANAKAIGCGADGLWDGMVTVSGGVLTVPIQTEWCAPGVVPGENADPATKAAYPYAVLSAPTLAVGELTGLSAAWTGGDRTVTNRIIGTGCGVPAGTTNVRLIYTVDPAYTHVDGALVREIGAMTGDVTVDDPPTVAHRTVEYVDARGRKLTNDTFAVVTAETHQFSDGWYLVEGNVKRSVIDVLDGCTASLILADGASLVLTGASYRAGINVSKGEALNIYAQAGGTGHLKATGGTYYGAGIGGDYEQSGGTITVNGGIVEAKGGNSAAGIGGGSTYGNGGTVKIRGGTVRATGRSSGAGIGGGWRGAGGSVEITGGRVYAYGGENASDIGRGRNDTTTTISDGTVTLSGGLLWKAPEIWWTIAKGCDVVNPSGDPDYPYAVVRPDPICEGGDIEEVEDGVWVVTPEGNVVSVTIMGLLEGETVSAVRIGGIDIPAGAFRGFGTGENVKDFSLALNPAGKVTIGKEEIQVAPTIGDLDDGEPFTRGEGSVAVMVKAIPGLKYVLVRAETVEGCRQDGGRTVVKSVTAKGARVTLSDDKPPKGQAFYWVVVSVP